MSEDRMGQEPASVGTGGGKTSIQHFPGVSGGQEEASPDDLYRREVPARGLGISVLALAAAATISILWPDALREYAGFVWILALVPLALLSYYKGWQGAALASVATMVVFTVVQLGVSYWMGESVNWPFYGLVTIVLMAVSFGAGWVTERLHQDRVHALKMAYEDPLTGLATRRHLEEFLKRQFDAAKRGRPLCVALFDLDEFKAFNDRYGHGAGDELLSEVGRVFRENTRAVNLSGRYGGEEFLSVLPDADLEGARTFAERVRREIAGLAIVDGQGCTISAGVARYAHPMSKSEELVNAADQAMYAAKDAGGDAVRVDGASAGDSGPAAPGSSRGRSARRGRADGG